MSQSTETKIDLSPYCSFFPPEQERLSVMDGSGRLWAEHLRAGRPSLPQDHLPLGGDKERRVPRQKGAPSVLTTLTIHFHNNNYIHVVLHHAKRQEVPELHLLRLKDENIRPGE